MPVTVYTSTANMLGYGGQTRKLFYAKGLFWLFYGNGSNGAFKTSADGINWSDETTFGYGSLGFQFAVVYDGTDYVHVAWAAGGTNIYYRRGLLNTDGTITWSSDWINTGEGPADYPSIALDSDGHVWIGYGGYYANSNITPSIVRNDNTDGTWLTSSGFPYLLNSALTASWVLVIPVALSGGKVFALYVLPIQKLYGKLYDPSTGWGAEETLSEYTTHGYMDGVAEGDDVHFVYQIYPPYGHLRYNKRSSNGTLGTEVDVEPLTYETKYSLSIDAETGILYIFYSGANSVRLCRKVGGVLESPQDFVVGEGGGNQPVRVFLKKYSRYIGVAWHKASPTELRFQAYTILPSSLKSNSHTL